MSINSSLPSMNLNKIDDWLSKPATAINIPTYGLGIPQIRWDRYNYSATLNELSTLIFNAYDKELHALENQPLSVSRKLTILSKHIDSSDELINKFRKIENKVNEHWMNSSLGKMGMFFHKAQNTKVGDELSLVISERTEISKEKLKILAQKEAIRIEQEKAKKLAQENAKKIAEENAKRQEKANARKRAETYSKTQSAQNPFFMFEKQQRAQNPFFMFEEIFETFKRDTQSARSEMFGVEINGQKYWVPNGASEFFLNGIHYKINSNNNNNYSGVPPATYQYNPYEVLGLPKNATSQQIKKQYHKLALERHPDKNVDDPQATVKFQLLNEAYSLLKDPAKRQDFDRFGVIR